MLCEHQQIIGYEPDIHLPPKTFWTADLAHVIRRQSRVEKHLHQLAPLEALTRDLVLHDHPWVVPKLPCSPFEIDPSLDILASLFVKAKRLRDALCPSAATNDRAGASRKESSFQLLRVGTTISNTKEAGDPIEVGRQPRASSDPAVSSD